MTSRVVTCEFSLQYIQFNTIQAALVTSREFTNLHCIQDQHTQTHTHTSAVPHMHTHNCFNSHSLALPWLPVKHTYYRSERKLCRSMKSGKTQQRHPSNQLCHSLKAALNVVTYDNVFITRSTLTLCTPIHQWCHVFHKFQQKQKHMGTDSHISYMMVKLHIVSMKPLIAGTHTGTCVTDYGRCSLWQLSWLRQLT